MSVRILVADDHQIIRQGLRMLLAQEPDFEVVGEAGDGQDAVDQTNDLQPDVVLMDVNMPVMNGIEATRRLKQQHPEIKVIVLSMFDDKHFIEAMQTAGASGYVVKEAAYELLVAAIREVLAEGMTAPYARENEGPREGSDLHLTMDLRN